MHYGSVAVERAKRRYHRCGSVERLLHRLSYILPAEHGTYLIALCLGQVAFGMHMCLAIRMHLYAIVYTCDQASTSNCCIHLLAAGMKLMGCTSATVVRA